MKNNNLLWLIVLFLLGFFLLMPGMHGGLFFWIFLILGFLILFAYLSGMGERSEDEAATDEADPEGRERFDLLASRILDVSGDAHDDGVFCYKGRLRIGRAEALEAVAEAAEAGNREFFLQDEGKGNTRLVILPEGTARAGDSSAARPKYGIHWALFIATLLTTTWAGAAHQGVNLLKEPGQFMVGVPYSLGLMLILGFHEMGHYLTARYHRMDVSPPYFIPVPFALGTFGAFISMRSAPRDRRALFDVAIAGPLAGLLVAVPALLIGLPLSTFVEGPPAVGMLGGGANPGASSLLALLAKLSVGAELSTAHAVILHPLAFAGWLGLLLTALNLLPIGQLDGGHIAQAMFGSSKAQVISSVAMLGLFLLALFVWPALLFFAVLVFIVAGGPGIPPRDDMTHLSKGRLLLGYAVFVLLLLIVVPLPHAFYNVFGMQCPYL